MWKTIRKTQYDNYEGYFQVFRGFSKKSYPSSANCVNRVPGITDDVHLSSYWSSRIIYSFSSVETEIV